VGRQFTKSPKFALPGSTGVYIEPLASKAPSQLATSKYVNQNQKLFNENFKTFLLNNQPLLNENRLLQLNKLNDDMLYYVDDELSNSQTSNQFDLELVKNVELKAFKCPLSLKKG
jgi:hypothetical protein